MDRKLEMVFSYIITEVGKLYIMKTFGQLTCTCNLHCINRKTVHANDEWMKYTQWKFYTNKLIYQSFFTRTKLKHRWQHIGKVIDYNIGYYVNCNMAIKSHLSQAIVIR